MCTHRQIDGQADRHTAIYGGFPVAARASDTYTERQRPSPIQETLVNENPEGLGLWDELGFTNPCGWPPF